MVRRPAMYLLRVVITNCYRRRSTLSRRLPTVMSALALLLATPHAAGKTAPVITSVSGTLAQGAVLTIVGFGFGKKSPAKPYLWAPMTKSLKPSPLGVIKSWASIAQLAYQNGCGPAPGTGCAAGTPSDGVHANRWTAAIYSPSHYSASGKDWNSYGQRTYVYRKSKKTFSYYGDPTKNVKDIRIWGTSRSQFLTYPDFAFGVWNGRVGAEYVPRNGPLDYTMPPAKLRIAQGPVNKWYSEEFEIASNSGPTTADGDFRLAVDGGPWLCHFPNRQWEENTLTLKAPRGYRGDGTMKILYPIHMVVESGGPWVPTAAGSQYFAADVYVDTTWARVMIGNSPDFTRATDREIEIPFQWNDDHIRVYENINSFPRRQPMYLFVVDAKGHASSGYPLVAGPHLRPINTTQ